MNDPTLYTTSNDLPRRHVDDISDEFSDEFGKMSGRCLDVGSGPGDTAVDFILPKLNKDATLVCSDISEEMVKFTKEKYMGNNRLSFAKLDIQSPNLSQDLIEQFDHVISTFCLHWCQDLRQVFENIFNLLRPGGTAFLIFIANSPGVNSYKELAAMPCYQPYMKDVDLYTPVFQHSAKPRKGLKALMKDTGFEVRHCSVRGETYIFDSDEELSKFILSINPFIGRIPANLVESYEEDLVRRYAGHNITLTKKSNGKNAYNTICVTISSIIAIIGSYMASRILKCGTGRLVRLVDRIVFPYLRIVRRTLRRQYGAPDKSRFGIMYNPALFAKFDYMSRRDLDDFTEEYRNEISKMSGRCIDIGSGPGDVVADCILPRMDPKATIVCSDISESMVIFGKEEYKDNQRLSFMKLDIESPDLPKDLMEHFDHVTSSYCLHWCQDTRRAFGNIFNLLRPGGTAFLAFSANFPNFNAYKGLASILRYQPYMKDADRYIPVFQHHERPRGTLEKIIKDVGFEIQHCSVREKSYTFDNPDDLSKFMLAVNPFINRIPAHLKEKYEKDLFEEVKKQNIIFNKNNNSKYEYSILCIYHTFLVYLKKPLTNNE